MCCPQDFKIPFHLQHHILSYSGRNKEGWCLFRASKNIPPVLRVLGSVSLARVGPRAMLFYKWINKRRILSRKITSSNKIKVGLPIKGERKNITRGACSNQWEIHCKKSKRITCNLFIGTNFFCPDTRQCEDVLSPFFIPFRIYYMLARITLSSSRMPLIFIFSHKVSVSIKWHELLQ